MEGSVAGGKYQLEREVARGGMGSIWVAFDPQLKRRVVLKKMLWEGSAPAELHAQFEREAQAIARLQSPHVVQVFDYGIAADGAPFIVMELLDGETLDDRLERQKKLSLSQLAVVVGQIARGLGAAHAAGIAHRDLKPANVFLTRGDGGETAKLLDFGLASIGLRGGGEDVVAPDVVLGTPLYMAPEQIERREVDHRSDLWALAVICYRALAGEFPFRPGPLGEMFLRIRRDAAPALSRLAPELPAEIDAFFDRALAKEPGGRFQSAREIAAALSSLAERGEGTRPAKVLVIDDEQDVVGLIQQRFRRQISAGAFTFLFAEDGLAGLAQLQNHPDIDVVLSDINMPKMDGLTFLGRIGEVNPIVKVIVMSAYGDMTNIRTAMNRGAFDFLTKPLNFKDLEAVLTKTAAHVRAMRGTFRSTEENKILRMFFGEGIVDRLLPMIRATDHAGVESFEATLVSVGVCDFGRVVGRVADDVALRRLNANLEIIVPEATARGAEITACHDDTLLAVFRGEGSAPRALEACDAIQSRLRAAADRFGAESSYAAGVAIGVDTGVVVCGGVGSSGLRRFEYKVMGDVVKRVGRLQAIAEPHQIVVGEGLHELATASYVIEPVGPLEVSARLPPATGFRLLRRCAPAREGAHSALAETVCLPSSVADVGALQTSAVAEPAETEQR
jgi:CheY-like chemotaxis protein